MHSNKSFNGSVSHNHQFKPCKVRNDAIFQSPDKNVFVLVEHHLLWKYNIKSQHWSQYELHRTYYSLVDGALGGVIDKQNKTWFFKSMI